MRKTTTALLLASLAISSAAYAQTENQKRKGAQGNAVATQPSNNPFSNPLGQPIPPAVSVNPANPSQNTGRTNVPLQR